MDALVHIKQAFPTSDQEFATVKKKVFNYCIFPVLTYGAETWRKSKELQKKLRTTQSSME